MGIRAYLQIISATEGYNYRHTGWKIPSEYYSPNGELHEQLFDGKIVVNSKSDLPKGHVILWLCDFYFLTKQKDKIVIRNVQQKKFKDKLPSDFNVLKTDLFLYLSSQQDKIHYEFQYLRLKRKYITIYVMKPSIGIVHVNCGG